VAVLAFAVLEANGVAIHASGELAYEYFYVTDLCTLCLKKSSHLL